MARVNKSLLLRNVRAFLACTQIHGVQYIAPAGFRNVAERASWILIVVVSFVWGSWLLYGPVVAWGKEPVEVSKSYLINNVGLV